MVNEAYHVSAKFAGGSSVGGVEAAIGPRVGRRAGARLQEHIARKENVSQ